MSEKELKLLGELGFDQWIDNKPNYKENYPLVHELSQWIREEFSLFIQIEIGQDSLYFWKIIEIPTRAEKFKNDVGYDSPELALESGIKYFLEHGNNERTTD